MELALIDTNLLIRFFSNDDVSKAKRVKDLLVSGKNKILLLDMVVAECFWVLTKVDGFYSLKPEEVADLLIPVIESDHVVANKQALRLTLDICIKENISFIDAYEIAMSAELGVSTIYSFDKKLAKVSEIKVKEP